MNIVVTRQENDNKESSSTKVLDSSLIKSSSKLFYYAGECDQSGVDHSVSTSAGTYMPVSLRAVAA